MDPITHGLLGASLTRSLPKTWGPKQLCWVGVLAAMMPDLDVFIYSPHNIFLSFIYHRHFTHALSFIVFGAALVAAVVLAVFPAARQYRKGIVWAALLGIASHSFLDCCTSYGTLWFWPWSFERVAWDWIAIVDPVFTLLLLIGVIGSLVLDSFRPALLGLFFALGYLGFGIWQHHRVMQALIAYAEQQSMQIQRQRALPTLANLRFWHGLITDTQGMIHLLQVDAFLWRNCCHVTTRGEFPVVTLQNLPATIRENPLWLQDSKTFIWFTDGWLAQFDNRPITLADLRYTTGQMPELIALWGIYLPQQDQQQMQLAQWIKAPQNPIDK